MGAWFDSSWWSATGRRGRADWTARLRQEGAGWVVGLLGWLASADAVIGRWEQVGVAAQSGAS